MDKKLSTRLFPLALASLCVGGGTAWAQDGKVTASLAIDASRYSQPNIMKLAQSGQGCPPCMPTMLILSATKPTGIKKAPAYKATPLYGVIKVGNGPKANHIVAIDVPATGEPEIFLDLNGDGDLTNDGTGTWTRKTVNNGSASYSGSYVFRASYGTPKKETSHADYGLEFWWEPDRGSNLGYYRAAARIGSVQVEGKTYRVEILENDNDGLFNKLYVKGEKPAKPEDIFLGQGAVDGRGTFSFEGKNYYADITPDGSQLTLVPTAKSIRVPVPVAAKPPELLPVGSAAPDFSAVAWGGGDLKLSSLKGQIVVLDFWATWCGPCQQAMPHLEKVFQQVKNQGVYVLALDVWDEQKPYDKWVPANSQTYHFNIARDQAGRADGNIAKAKFNVSGIPTTYVIDKDGKIAAAILGYDPGDHQLEDALAKLGVKVESVAQQSTVPGK